MHSTNANRSLALLTVACFGVLPVTVNCSSAAEPTLAAVDLKAAPANAWIKIHEAETGRREQPIFVYAHVIKKFVLATGMQAYGGNVSRHYDTEEFDLVTRRWINAYPPSVGDGRPAS